MLIDDLRAFARDPKGYPDSAAAHLCSDAADMIEQSRKDHLDALRLSTQWADKHDKLLDFVQNHPGALKAWIAATPSPAVRSTGEQQS